MSRASKSASGGAARSAASGQNARSSVGAENLRVNGQTSWQMSQP
ncbi:MAG: hypothetical protein M5U29_17105 [Anaerolineae bacterium]|nr:hypothetical protein [Anaerolineae bacterium]